MEFSAAISLLVQVHEDEITRLQAKIAELELKAPNHDYPAAKLDLRFVEGHSAKREPLTASLATKAAVDIQAKTSLAKIDKSASGAPVNFHTWDPTRLSPPHDPCDDHPEAEDSHSYYQNYHLASEDHTLRISENGSAAASRLPKETIRFSSSGGSGRLPSIRYSLYNENGLHGRASAVEFGFDERATSKDSFTQMAPEVLDRWTNLLRKLTKRSISLTLRELWAEEEKQRESDYGPSRSLPKRDMAVLKVLERRFQGSRNKHVVLILNDQKSTSLSSRGWVMHPASKKRILWVLLCFMVLAYEMFMATMSPFGIADADWAATIDIYCAAFWTSDVLLNFFCGSYVDGKVEMRLKVIARRYIRGWFMFDAGIVILQWLVLLFPAASRVGTTALVVKGLRFLRLLRLAKINSWIYIEEMASGALGENAFQFINSILFGSEIAKFLCAAVLFLHCSSCAWYDVGRTGNGWVSRYAELVKGELWHDYLVAMHWSLSQFQGGIDIYPGASTRERAFACLSSGVCILALALFLSSLTQLLVSASEDQQRKSHEYMLMRNFLHRHAMQPNLLVRATHYVHTRAHFFKLDLKLKQDEMALQLFPIRMRQQMRAEIVAQGYCTLPVFAYLKHSHSHVFVNLCESAVTGKLVAEGEDLFVSFEMAKHFYFIVSGEAVYYSNETNVVAKHIDAGLGSMKRRTSCSSNYSNYSNASQGRSVESLANAVEGLPSSPKSPKAGRGSKRYSLKRGPSQDRDSGKLELSVASMTDSKRHVVSRLGRSEFANEAALFLSYTHEGDLYCVNHAQCFVMDGDTFVGLIAHHTLPSITISSYAKRFFDIVNELKSSTETKVYMELIDAELVLADLPLPDIPG